MGSTTVTTSPLRPDTSTTNNDSRTSLISSKNYNKPIGIRIFGSCFQFKSLHSKRLYHKSLVLILTFIAYAAFHMGRRPLSVVKNIFNRNCSALEPPDNGSNVLLNNLDDPSNFQLINGSQETKLFVGRNDISCNWAPFDDDATADRLLGLLDSAFLSSYAIAMFGSGIVAERMNLRYFITIGCIISGTSLIAFGLAKPFDIHSLVYFISLQIVSGVAQSIGWPVVVTCISRWYEPKRLGLIFGIWNSHTNLGNILGATIAGFFVRYHWDLSFIVPGLIMIIVGVILFLFLVPTPEDVDLNESKGTFIDYGLNHSEQKIKKDKFTYSNGSTNSTIHQMNHANNSDKTEAISFLKALAIPGVVEYSFCLFFSKLVSYTFLYWLPRYIAISTSSNSEHSAYLSTPVDMGGILGAIIAGHLSDKYKANGITCTIMLILAIPSMFIYQQYGPISSLNNISLQLLVGILVNGPYCLITTSVSADLGNRITDGRAMATVAAIIDGMGSLGAVLGPLAAGFASDDCSLVFLMLMMADVLATLCLIRITSQEIQIKLGIRGSLGIEAR